MALPVSTTLSSGAPRTVLELWRSLVEPCLAPADAQGQGRFSTVRLADLCCAMLTVSNAAMTEQVFIGDAPTTEAGKEIRFPSGEVWVALHTCITSHVYPDLPFFPAIAARDAEVLATAINGALDSPSCTKHFGDQTLLEDLGTPKEEVLTAEKYLGWMKRFAVFLHGCGGCRPG